MAATLGPARRADRARALGAAPALSTAPIRRERAKSVFERVLIAAAVVVGSVATGYGFATMTRPEAGSRMLPWLAGRSLGLGAIAALTALTAVGIWLKHPSRTTWRFPTPEAALRTHAALAAAAMVLLVGHITAMALDGYAKVGWVGALVPGLSAYRTKAIALGVIAFWLMLAIAGTAALAGRIGGPRWLVVHRLALPLYGLAWLHGVLAGTDTPVLRLAYGFSGLCIVGLAVSRYWAGGSVVSEPSSRGTA
jgi:DMSO/TMAO reductase YedYZ heme-binding membrane subunit